MFKPIASTGCACSLKCRGRINDHLGSFRFSLNISYCMENWGRGWLHASRKGCTVRVEVAVLKSGEKEEDLLHRAYRMFYRVEEPWKTEVAVPSDQA
jgi:hypothetical protein